MSMLAYVLSSLCFFAAGVVCAWLVSQREYTAGYRLGFAAGVAHALNAPPVGQAAVELP